MTNYICINGNKTELTEEQLKQLGIEIPKANPFTKSLDNSVDAYFINSMGVIQKAYDTYNMLYEVGNYCTDKAIMQQRALHETLNRLLWRYSMEHDGDKIDWQDTKTGKWYACFDIEHNEWTANYVTHRFDVGVFFYNRRITEDAIEEIVKPFMKDHPEFEF
jgi:hypothetical protein